MPPAILASNNNASDYPSIPQTGLPGLFLAPSASFRSGPGTHVMKTSLSSPNVPAIYASISGPIVMDNTTKPPTLCIPRSRTAFTALTNKPGPANAPQNDITNAPDTTKAFHVLRQKNNTLPAVDSIVLARVTRVQQKQATVDILLVDSEPCPTHSTLASLSALPISDPTTAGIQFFQGIIRRENIRAFDKDRTNVADSFRVGDVVRGVVISLGDAGGSGGYYISTGRDEFGVVMARESVAEFEEGSARGRGKGGWMMPGNWKEMVAESGKREGRKVGKPV